MTMLRDKNDRALLRAAGIVLCAGVLVGLGTAQSGFKTELLTGTAHAAVSTEMPVAHNVHADMPASIVRAPSDLPAAVGERGAETVRVELETIERMGNLADGTTYRYWTFNGQVPGPFVRVRVGDT